MGIGLSLTDLACRGGSGAGTGPLRIAKGHVNGWDDTFFPVQPIPAVSLTSGSVLVVFIACNNCTPFATGGIKWGAVNLIKRGEQAFGIGGILQCWTLDNVSTGTADITPNGNVADICALAMWAVEVKGLKNPSLDALWSSAGSGTSATVTASAPTAQASEILLAAVGCDGNSGAALGTWGNGFAQGQSDGSDLGPPNAEINEGYRVVNGVGTFTADDTGRSSLDWAMILLALKGN